MVYKWYIKVTRAWDVTMMPEDVSPGMALRDRKPYEGVTVEVHPLMIYKVIIKMATRTIQLITQNVKDRTFTMAYVTHNTRKDDEEGQIKSIKKCHTKREVLMEDLNVQRERWHSTQ